MIQFKERNFLKTISFRFSIISLLSLITITPQVKPEVSQVQNQVATQTNATQSDINLLESILADEEIASENKESAIPYEEQNSESLTQILQEVWNSFREERYGNQEKLTLGQRWQLTKDVIGALAIAAKAKWDVSLDDKSKEIYRNDYRNLSGFQKANTNLRFVGQNCLETAKSHKLAIGGAASLIAAIIIYKKFFSGNKNNPK